MRQALLALALSGCALTSRGATLSVRYFSPETAGPSVASRPITTNAFALRIGRVTSSGNIRSRLLHRDSDVEVSEYETLRWTENPEVYVERSLGHELFDERGLRQAIGGIVPTLDVEVTAFEQTRRGGRVQLRYEMHDEEFVLASGTVTSEHDATGSGVEQVVVAIAIAMHDASAQVATAIANRVASLHQ